MNDILLQRMMYTDVHSRKKKLKNNKNKTCTHEQKQSRK